jgi:putative glutamine amidotransferase
MFVGLVVGRYPEERYSLHRGYVDALRALDAVPVIVPASTGCGTEVADPLLERCDAIVATGGGDLDPRGYGQAPGAHLMEVDADRDAVEIRAVREFHAAGRPVLGICRGAQTVAVAMGGSLVQDLPSSGFTGHWDEARQYEPVHPVVADAGSEAAAALGGAGAVNSIHHQAIYRTGSVLHATAWSPDGVIEAAEADGLLALQWHPERLFSAGDRRHLAPFEWLVKRA